MWTDPRGESLADFFRISEKQNLEVVQWLLQVIAIKMLATNTRCNGKLKYKCAAVQSGIINAKCYKKAPTSSLS